MITQIEIDGFKSFKDFKVELAPFQVIVGPNGSGKSNLFDALQLLSHLMEDDIASAFQALRGRDYEQFTALPDGQYTDRIRIAVEMLVDRKVRDDWGDKIDLKYTRLRYELHIILQSDRLGPDQLHIVHESLQSIPQDKDGWCKKYGLSSQNSWVPQTGSEISIFIDTKLTKVAVLESIADKSEIEVETPMIYLYNDEGSQERVKRFYANEVQRTVLSREVEITYPHVFAARRELFSLRFLHLNPEVLRQPSPTKSPRFLATDGGNLATTLVRMQTEDKFALSDVSLDMVNLVPGIVDIEIDEDKAHNQYIVRAKTSDQRTFSSGVLSDGTLRLLALATLRNDPQFHGVLCLEEPENGVHPSRLKNMARLLRDMATDFKDPEQIDESLRQVLVTTHSPAFISQSETVDSLLFAYTVTQIVPGQPTLDVTRMVPVATQKTQSYPLEGTDIDKAEASYTLDEVRKYLDSEAMNGALTHLSER